MLFIILVSSREKVGVYDVITKRRFCTNITSLHFYDKFSFLFHANEKTTY